MNPLCMRCCVAVALLLGLTAGCKPPPAPASPEGSTGSPAPTGDVQGGIRLTPDGVEINGVSLAYPLKIGALEQVLGKATRKSERVNTIYTWDNAGIFAYTKPGDEQINSLCLAFATSQEFDFYPQTPYPHTLQIGQQAIAKGAGKKELQAAGFKADPDIPIIFEAVAAGVSLLAEFDESSRTKVAMIEIDLD